MHPEDKYFDWLLRLCFSRTVRAPRLNLNIAQQMNTDFNPTHVIAPESRWVYCPAHLVLPTERDGGAHLIRHVTNNQNVYSPIQRYH